MPAEHHSTEFVAAREVNTVLSAMKENSRRMNEICDVPLFAPRDVAKAAGGALPVSRTGSHLEDAIEALHSRLCRVEVALTRDAAAQQQRATIHHAPPLLTEQVLDAVTGPLRDAVSRHEQLICDLTQALNSLLLWQCGEKSKDKQSDAMATAAAAAHPSKGKASSTDVAHSVQKTSVPPPLRSPFTAPVPYDADVALHALDRHRRSPSSMSTATDTTATDTTTERPPQRANAHRDADAALDQKVGELRQMRSVKVDAPDRGGSPQNATRQSRVDQSGLTSRTELTQQMEALSPVSTNRPAGSGGDTTTTNETLGSSVDISRSTMIPLVQLSTEEETDTSGYYAFWSQRYRPHTTPTPSTLSSNPAQATAAAAAAHAGGGDTSSNSEAYREILSKLRSQ